MRVSNKLLKEILEKGDLFSAATKDPSLKFQRSCIMKDAYPYKKKRGKFVCRLCGKKPPGKRIHWCSDACVLVCLIRCSPNRAIGWVRLRDKGVCAKCGLDTKSLKGLSPEALIEKGFKPRRSFWEADHILPVIEGGGHCDLSNFRTLCIPCHKIETKELAFRRRKNPTQDK